MSDVFWGFFYTPSPLIRFCPISNHARISWCPILILTQITFYKKDTYLGGFQNLWQKNPMYVSTNVCKSTKTKVVKIQVQNVMGKRMYTLIGVYSENIIWKKKCKKMNLRSYLLSKHPISETIANWKFGDCQGTHNWNFQTAHVCIFE